MILSSVHSRKRERGQVELMCLFFVVFKVLDELSLSLVCMSLICICTRPLSCVFYSFYSSTSGLGAAPAPIIPDQRLGEENKGHQMLMKMGKDSYSSILF